MGGLEQHRPHAVGHRVDPAQVFFGMRLNGWVFGIVVLGALLYVIVSLRRRTSAPV